MPGRIAEYRLVPEARRDLEEIWLFTLREWGLEQANRYADDLTDIFAQLAERPGLGRSCDHIRQGYRRRRAGQHIVYFRVTDYGIVVVRVLHARMDAPRHL